MVQNDATRPLEHTLAALSSGQVDGPAVMITQADLQVERVLGRRQRGTIPRELMPKLLAALARCQDVMLDQMAVKTSSSAVLPHVCVEDRGDGFMLFIEPDTVNHRSIPKWCCVVWQYTAPCRGSEPDVPENARIYRRAATFAPDAAAELVSGNSSRPAQTHAS